MDFREMYDSYAPDVYRFSLWLAGSRTEAEDITSHPVRRRIVLYLMTFGNAGILTGPAGHPRRARPHTSLDLRDHAALLRVEEHRKQLEE